jgi:hypothetical protein
MFYLSLKYRWPPKSAKPAVGFAPPHADNHGDDLTLLFSGLV